MARRTSPAQLGAHPRVTPTIPHARERIRHSLFLVILGPLRFGHLRGDCPRITNAASVVAKHLPAGTTSTGVESEAMPAGTDALAGAAATRPAHSAR